MTVVIYNTNLFKTPSKIETIDDDFKLRLVFNYFFFKVLTTVFKILMRYIIIFYKLIK